LKLKSLSFAAFKTREKMWSLGVFDGHVLITIEPDVLPSTFARLSI